MFLNKKMQNKISIRKFKSFKFSFKKNSLENILTHNDFVLFYFYEYFSKENLLKFQEIIRKNELRFCRINKNFLKNTSFKNLNTFAKNNTLMIFNANNSEFSKDYFIQLQNIKNIHLAGILLKKKFFRPFELKHLLNLNSKILQKQLLITLSKNILNIKKTLILNKH
jgi:hypothetical protein